MQKQAIKLSGLTCPACKKVTEKRLGGIEGVTKVEVTLDSGIAAIDANKEITILEIKEALKDTPYQVIEE